MARLARVVIPGLPHHITQRGNRRQQTSFHDDDYAEYSALMGQCCKGPRDYRSSSARAHLKGKDDALVKVSPLLKMAGNWRRLLTSAATEEEIETFRRHERTGRVLGDDDFQKRLEKNLGLVLRRQKPGPKRASKR
jgi:putative transposase